MQQPGWAHSFARVTAIVLMLAVGAVAVPTAAAADPGGTSRYVPLAPTRILDTRVGLGAPSARPAAGALMEVQVTGQGGVPESGVTAVALNVVVTNPRQLGYVQALPTGRGTPGSSSNINVFYPGQTASNLVTVPVGDGGRISLYDVAGGDLVVDVSGYFEDTAQSTDGRYQALSPARVVDSRNRTGLPALTPPAGPSVPANPGDAVNCGNFSTWAEANAWFWTYYPHYGDVARLDGNDDLIPCEALPGRPSSPQPPPAPPGPPPFDPNPRPAPGESFTVQLTGRGGVPASGVSSVAMTVTATQSRSAGFVQVVPTGGGTALGTTSNVNLTGAGQTVANLVIVPLGPGGNVTLYTSSGAHLIIDVVGWFTDQTATASSTGLFVPVTPGRLLDSRAGSALAAGSPTALSPTGHLGVPASGVSAVFVNATATQTTGSGYLQLFPEGRGVAGASSSVNFTGAGETVANAAIGALGDGGRVTMYTSTRTHALVDVLGYFTSDSPVDPSPEGLQVRGAGEPPVVYDRATWNHWVDEDGDCQDTRAEVLIAESTTAVVLSADGCSVLSGTWVDPYSGLTWYQASDLDIDHMVPLKNAHDSGGWAWGAAQKETYANDLAHVNALVAVEDGLNQSKGSRGPDEWKPPAVAAWCGYATAWVTLKQDNALTVTQPELDALVTMLATC
ncbi:HNH endonuclease [Cellulomonas sp. Root137]|uniref:HNH endonuclease n=1 Tax=Cellulomonas sp. Root137 TaxID=1736459 RepID=UPI0006F3FD76|nr:HNH endonuclease [Cellulomonas sp. Root137]KQY47820.1 hypothetical protein ASD18_11200 [Cellulomonas sp. Root137]